MRKRVIMYFLVLAIISLLVFIYNVVLNGDQIIVFFPIISELGSWQVWGCIPLIIFPFVLVRTLFPPEAKYRIQFIVTFYIFFLLFSLSETMYSNELFPWLHFYGGYPRMSIYALFTLFTVLIIFLLVKLLRESSRKVISIVFWIADLLYVPICFIVLFLTIFASPHG